MEMLVNFSEHANACIVANLRRGDQGQGGWTKSVGATNGEGEIITESLHRRGATVSEPKLILEKLHRNPPSPSRHLEGTWLYGGIIKSHFGHFLGESVHRLRPFLANASRFDGIIFIGQPKVIDHQYVQETLIRYFNIPVDKLSILNRNTTVDSLITSPQESGIYHAPTDAYINYLGEIEKKYLNKLTVSGKNTSERIYISRKNYLHKGRILGIDAVAEILEKEGYSIICPENIAFSEQIRLAATAKEIVAEEGSALHIFDILGHRDCRLTILNRRKTSRWQDQLSRRFKSVHTFQDVVRIGSLFDGRFRPSDEPSLPDIESLIAFTRNNTGISFCEDRLKKNLREAISSDMKKLSLTLPDPP